MSLSCSCHTEGDWWYLIDTDPDFKPLSTSKRKRCQSCKELINVGADCLRFPCYRSPQTDVEERIYIDEVPLAPKYLCEPCGEIYLNLMALGYCYYMGDDLREQLKEYWELTGFVPAKE